MGTENTVVPLAGFTKTDDGDYQAFVTDIVHLCSIERNTHGEYVQNPLLIRNGEERVKLIDMSCSPPTAITYWGRLGVTWEISNDICPNQRWRIKLVPVSVPAARPQYESDESSSTPPSN